MNNKYKILMVTDMYYPNTGGIPEHVHHLTLELRKRGHRVEILTSKAKNKFFPFKDPDYVKRIGRGIKIPMNKSTSSFTFSPLITKRVKEILEEGRYDILHIHGSLAPTLPLLALTYSNAVNCFTFHAAHDESFGYEFFKPILKKAFRRIDASIAVSEVARDTMLRHFSGNYLIIPNGVDINKFSPSVKPIEKFRKDKEHIILFVGRFDPRKGLRFLLMAMPEIIQQHPNTRLLVIGGGFLKKYYKQFIKDSVKDRIVFLGVVPPEELPRYYRTASIFVSPATGGESLGIVLLEAMASCVPVVASRIPGYMQVIENGKDGFLVEPEEPSAIARAVNRLLSSPELCIKMGRNGREKVERYYSWEKIAEEIENIYHKAFKEKNPHHHSERD